jgi:hypothetical protein
VDPCEVFFVALLVSVSSVCFAGDADEILAVLQANFEGCSREDADALMETCFVDMPDRKKFREESVKLWREKDIHYSIVEFRVVRIDGSLATAEIV